MKQAGTIEKEQNEKCKRDGDTDGQTRSPFMVGVAFLQTFTNNKFHLSFFYTCSCNQVVSIVFVVCMILYGRITYGVSLFERGKGLIFLLASINAFTSASVSLAFL